MSWPLEPQRYDLVVERDASFIRVQVKTTTSLDANSYSVAVTNSRAHGRAAYSSEEIDSFLVVDRELNAYLVPICEVQGRQRLSLNAYGRFMVMTAGNVLDRP